MGKGGLEPPRLAALVPKTSVAAITPLPLGQLIETASIIPAVIVNDNRLFEIHSVSARGILSSTELFS
jgi:hypothetical protein